MLKTMKNNFKWFKKMPIAHKITIIYAGFFSFVLLLLSAFIMFNAFYFYRDASKKEIDETITKVANYIKSNDEIDDETILQLNPYKTIEVKVTPESLAHRFKDNKNDLSKNSDKKPPDDFPPPRINESDDGVVKKPPNGGFEMETIKGMQYMYNQKIVRGKNENYIIQVFRPYYQEQRILRIFLVIFIVTNILGIVCAYFIGRFISKRLLKPIVDISETAKTISINDLSQRINVPEPNDEIRTLALTFNDMIAGLEDAVGKQKQFISDASHELRTPISVIQGYANLIDRWGKTDTDILQESIDSIKFETEHMSNLVKKLLFLARAEKNLSMIQKEPLCINSILDEIVKEFMLTKDGIDLSFEGCEDLYINGDADMIKQMIWVFLDNAVKYSNPNGQKEISIKIYSVSEAISQKAIIEISDNGIGISKEDIPLVFDRFYRADKSRNNEIPGTGLGLSIAQRIIDGHNGQVRVESELGRGTTFIVSFPITQPNIKSIDEPMKQIQNEKEL